jgi:phospholipid/cholesterol/gamma-HCH transport system substrate-binding protein
MFVLLGSGIFISAIYLIGSQKNLFGSTITVQSIFKSVNGLKIGNNVRLSGINIGSVSEVALITDSSVMVHLLIRKSAARFINKDALASISSDGLMGEKMVAIYPGTGTSMLADQDKIGAKDPIDMDDIMLSVKNSVDNIDAISGQLAEFTFKLNNGKGALSKLINDEKLGTSIDETLSNLKKSSKGLSENMEAAKSNILLRGYFNKKKREAAKKAEELKTKQEQSKKNK